MSEHRRTEDRLRDALAAEASSIEPTDRWETVVERLDGRRTRWWGFPARHPLSTAAGVSVVAVVLVVALTTLDDPDRAGVEFGAPGSQDELLVATTEDERLVTLDSSGREVREIADLRELDGLVGSDPSATTTMEDLGALEQLAVDPGGSSAFVARVGGSTACPRSDQLGTGIYEVPLSGGLGSEPPRRGDAVAAHPVFSPDGAHLAFVTTASGDPCDVEELVIEVKDVSSWEVSNRLTVPEGTVPVDLVWLEQRTLGAVLPLGTDGPESPLSLVLADPHSDAALQLGPSDLTLDAGTRFGRAADGRLLIAGRLVTEPGTTVSGTEWSVPPEIADAAEISTRSVWAARLESAGEDGAVASYELLFTLPMESRLLSSLGAYRSAGVAAIAASGSEEGQRHDLVLWEGGDPVTSGGAGVVATEPLLDGRDEEDAAQVEGTSSPAPDKSAPGCSADGTEPIGRQDGLPEAVAATRAAIAAAARNCDLAMLEAQAGPGFLAGFGGGDPSTVWSEAERRGAEPLRLLVELLDLPYTTIESEATGTVYVWPSAHAYPWSELPEADLEAIRSLYGDEQIAEFEEAGSYVGYRIAIVEDGTWGSFVVGD